MSATSLQDLQILERMNHHPHLKARIEVLLAIAEDTGDVVKADDAEKQVIEEVRRLGNEVLTNWAEKRIEKCDATLEPDDKIIRSGKKNSTGTARSGKSKSLRWCTSAPASGYVRSAKALA